MTALCDLHNHSVFSDGTDTPAQLLDRAEALGLRAVALTDHNTVAGLPDFLAAAEGRGVWAIPGTEFSTEWQGTELHILALFLKPEHFPAVTELLEDYTRRKDRSIMLSDRSMFPTRPMPKRSSGTKERRTPSSRI